MLPSTPEEKQAVIDYMNGQAPDLKVEFLQKVYVENVLSHQHAVWDVHTNVDRWWVITNPTNLYSQDQFPNMDLAVTFHVGICLRVPRSQRTKLDELDAEPFLACFRYVTEAEEALLSAQEVSDYQAVGVRCREALLAFTAAAQTVMPWTGPAAETPQQANFKEWVDHVCAVALPGSSQKERRHLLRTLLVEAWTIANWLTHAKTSNWYDAEAATSTVEHALGLVTSLAVRYVRDVPEACPSCESNRLYPQRGENTATPDVVWERPVCSKCGWTGDPVPVLPEPEAYAPDDPSAVPEGECIIPELPLRSLRRPGKSED
jgi:hypothetical protein